MNMPEPRIAERPVNTDAFKAAVHTFKKCVGEDFLMPGWTIAFERAIAAYLMTLRESGWRIIPPQADGGAKEREDG